MKKKSIILTIILLAMIIVFGLVFGTRLFSEKNYDNTLEPYIKEVVDEEVVVSGDIAYVDRQILINLKKSSARKKLENWIKEDGGIIVGEIPISNTYQIEFPEGTSKEDLERIAAQLEKKKEVEMAILHYAYLNDTDEINYSNEDWTKTQGREPNKSFSDESKIWDSLYPDGPNWWAEAIWLSGIGNMDVKFSDVNVGIIDSVFDTTHKDFEGAFKKVYQNPDNVAKQYSDAISSEDEQIKEEAGNLSHGTHVAGIIGARVNNYGISGVAPNAHLYIFSILGTDKHKYSGIIEFPYAIITLLQDDVRLINLSMGSERVYQAMVHRLRGEGLTADTSGFLSQYEKQRDYLEVFFRNCEQYYDFLLIKSAGNANNIKLVETTEEDEESELVPMYEGFREYDSDIDAEKKFETVEGVSVEDSIYYFDDEDVRKSILFVGATERIDKSGKFKLADFSCVGADIFAPGRDILSDLPNGGVGYDTGTSMAAPIVTGTAAMVWSANPDLTAAQVREILLKSCKQFSAIKKNKTIKSDISMLNSYLAVQAAVEARDNPEFKKKPEKAADNLAVIMGTIYEVAENSPSIKLENIPDLKLTITDDKELYQKDVNALGEEGTFAFFVKPGTYKLTVDCSYYDHYETEVTANEGDTRYLELGLGREETRKRLLNEYANSLNTFYNDSYQYSGFLYRDDGNQRYEKAVEGFDAERKLGYAIDDFDDDGESELLVIATDEDYDIILEMYIVDGDDVSIIAKEFLSLDDGESVTLPQSSSRGSEDCGLISCFVEEQTHKIYLQVSYNISAFIDGNCTSITSIRYEDTTFCDMQSIDVVGSSCEGSYHNANLELLKMGVPYPDIETIFEKQSPLYSCFDDSVYEICHARQKTLNTEYDENGWLASVQAITLFDSQEDLYIQHGNEQGTTIISVQEQHDLYDPIIEKYYQEMKAAESRTGSSYRTAFFGYADVDCNGIDELLLDYEDWHYWEIPITYDSPTAECLAMYTIENGKVKPVIESGYNGLEMTEVPFVHIYPGISLVEIGDKHRNNNIWESSSEFYVYRNGVISDKPVFSISSTYDRYEINGLRCKKNAYDNFITELYGNTFIYNLKIYNKEDHREYHGE